MKPRRCTGLGMACTPAVQKNQWSRRNHMWCFSGCRWVSSCVPIDWLKKRKTISSGCCDPSSGCWRSVLPSNPHLTYWHNSLQKLKLLPNEAIYGNWWNFWNIDDRIYSLQKGSCQHHVWSFPKSRMKSLMAYKKTFNTKNSSKAEETFGISPGNVNHSYLLVQVSLISCTCLWMPQLVSNSWSSDCCAYISPVWTTMWRWMFCFPSW